MADVSGPMTQASQTRLPDEHPGHDRQLVVAFACGDLPLEEIAEARALVARCRRCAAMVNELGVISAALQRDLVAPPRTRDFLLSSADAERLRGDGLARILRRLASPRLHVLQPLAGAAMAIGLVLMVATSVMPSFSGAADGAAPVGGAVPAAQEDDGARRSVGTDTGDAGVAPDAAASVAPGQEAPAGPEVGIGGESATGAAEDTLTDTSRTSNAMELSAPPTASDPTAPVGLGLLVIGAVALAVLVAARRLTQDPLLR